MPVQSNLSCLHHSIPPNSAKKFNQKHRKEKQNENIFAKLPKSKKKK